MGAAENRAVHTRWQEDENRHELARHAIICTTTSRCTNLEASRRPRSRRPTRPPFRRMKLRRRRAS
jgi:hypothetical protein